MARVVSAFIQVKVLCFATPVSFLSSTQRENNPLNPLLHYPFVLARAVTQQELPYVMEARQGNKYSSTYEYSQDGRNGLHYVGQHQEGTGLSPARTASF